MEDLDTFKNEDTAPVVNKGINDKPAIVKKAPNNAPPQISKQEKMKLIREHTQIKFEQMRLKARNTVKGGNGGQQLQRMGPIKGFSELQDSIIKMRENFDFMLYGKV